MNICVYSFIAYLLHRVTYQVCVYGVHELHAVEDDVVEAGGEDWKFVELGVGW